MNESSVPDYIRTIKYRITATIHRVKMVSKRNTFFTKVEWKRHQNIASTNLVKHQNQQSIFNHQLELDYQFHYDTNKNMFLEKKSDMIVIIDIDGDGQTIKNGGYARFDLSQPINQSQQNVERKLNLIKNPDTNAFIEFSLFYQPIQQTYPTQMSTSNISQMSNNISYLSQNQLKISSKTQINSIVQEQPLTVSSYFKESDLGDIVSKFESLTSQLKNKSSSNKQNKTSYSEENVGNSEQSNYELMYQIRQLKTQKQNLQTKLEYAEQEKRDLQRMLDKKSSEIISKTQQIHSLNNRISQLTDNIDQGNHKDADSQDEDRANQSQSKNRMKEKIESQNQQIQQLKEKLRNHEFRRSTSNISSITINMTERDNDEGLSVTQLQKTQRSLQKQLAQKSFTIGQLFNAAFQIGGAPLLDKLHNAIGLIENK